MRRVGYKVTSFFIQRYNELISFYRKASILALACTQLVYWCPHYTNTRTNYFSGAIFFWPSAKYETYGGFVGSTFVIGNITARAMDLRY